MKLRSLALYISFTLLSACNGGSGGGDGGLSTNACSVIGLNSRVINGTECSESGTPVVQINLISANGTGAVCTGSLLSSTKVLTAAHCVVTNNVTSASVRAGDRVIPVARISAHPDVAFDNQALAIFNDVAVLTLSEPAPGPTLPIILSRPSEVGDRLSLYGYGLDENRDLGVLKSGQFRVDTVTEHHLISGFEGDGSNSCNGDSGGPAIIEFIDDQGNRRAGIVAIVSSGNNSECQEGDISLYANMQNQSNLNFVLSIVPEARVE